MLQITNLHKRFGEKEILHGIDLSVQPGEIFGFIGHNGAGKTTTIRCVTGILPFETGRIQIHGHDIQKDPLACKRCFAYLPDNPDLYENMTGIQFLNFIADIFGMEEDDRMKQIESLSKELEIYDHLGDQIKALSHGMKQKVAVVSAFMHDPDLLILDEPFVGLDPKASYVLKQKMKQLCQQGGSVFFSSHVLEVVENLCDHLAIIKEGQILRNGTTQEILEGGKTLEEIFLELEQ